MAIDPVLPLVVSVLTAVVIAALGRHLQRGLADALAILASGTVTVLSALLAFESMGGPVIRWFGGWAPVQGFALGVGFVVDPFGAGTAAFAGLLVTAALVFSIWHFESAGRLFHVLMLLFLAGMEGFCLTGDLFNLFVFFELLSVSTYALAGYKIEERGPIQGAINFAVSNTVGSYLLLLGIALLYGHTHALNLAQIGVALQGQPLQGTLLAAVVLITVGLGVKAAIWPLHFWLPDAHAVAPTPVSVLFSGIMVELGLFGLARVYWTAFSGVPALRSADFSQVLMGVGTVTALWGAGMALLESHLKRLLAFSTMSHVGILLIGVATLRADGLAGSALYLLAHGFAKGALFMCAGCLLSRFGSVEVEALRGKGRALPWVGAAYFVGGLLLCDLPPFGTFVGRAWIEAASEWVGGPLPAWAMLTASAVSGAAILAAGGRIFFGVGSKVQNPAAPALLHKKEESQQRFSPGMPALAGAMVIGALCVGFLPHAALGIGAQAFVDRAGTAATVLHGAAPVLAKAPRLEVSAKARALGWGGVALALLLTGVALFGARAPKRLRRVIGLAVAPVARLLRRLQSGRLADDVTWIAAGAAAFGGILVWALRSR